jgi:serine/threonine protein kinase
VLERYTIIERMAVGGMGEVFLARQRGVGGFSRTVVIKKLLPDVEGNDDAAHRLLDEARIVAALSHENVVSIIEVGTEDELPIMALEYVHGENAGTLRNRAGKRDLAIPIAVCARIVCDAARGLHHAHEATDVEGRRLKVVHRDIAPKNLFVRVDGMTKVGDFGIAAAEQRLAKTATGAVTGTLSYMSPEQISSQPMGPASDQWSLGVVLWELLTGYRLFKAQGPAEVVDGILNAKLRSPRRLREDVPRELSDIAKAMLQRDVGKRFPSMEAVANAIEGAVPECVGVGGRAAVAAFVEDMSGSDLRERLKRIEEGAEVTNFGSSGPKRLKPANSPSSASRQAPDGNLGPETGQTRDRGASDTARTSGQTITVPEGKLLRGSGTGSGVAAPVDLQPQRSWRAAVVGGVVAVAAVIAVGVGLTVSGRPPDPADLTLAFLQDSRPGRSMVLREELLEDAGEYTIDEARMDAVAVVLAGLCDQRLDALIAHFSLPEEARRKASASQAQAELALEERARTALHSIGSEYATAALDMWAEECWGPIRWLEPNPPHEVQANIRTRIIPQIEDTAAWREAVVRRLLKRAGANVDVTMAKLWPIVAERQALIARYGAVPPEEMPAVRAQILAKEQEGRTALAAQLDAKVVATVENAVGQIAFIDFDDVGTWVPLFAYLPSVKAKEPGARP